MYDYNQLLETIISEIPIKKDCKVYGITFIAPPGIGKTTISRMLADKLGIYITANDKIRRKLEDFNIDPEKESKLVNQLAEDRTIYMLKNNTSMIIDANMRFFYETAMANFNKYDAKLYFLKLECNEEEILRRIDERSTKFGLDKENYSRAGREAYYKYKEKLQNSHFPEELVFFTIDMEKNVEAQVEQFIELLKKDLGE